MATECNGRSKGELITMEQNVLIHHGIEGQKWGKRNGPPYPLSRKIQKTISRDYRTHPIRKKNTILFKSMNMDPSLQYLKNDANEKKDFYKEYIKGYRDSGYSLLVSDPVFTQIFNMSVEANIAYKQYGQEVVDIYLGKYTKQKSKEKILEKYLKQK